MIQFLSLFSGIGAFEKALDRLGVEYNLVNYCEIDKHASKSYSAIHGVPESLNLGDITKVNTAKLPHIDMISYGFPCQDISLSGKMRGLFNEDGTQTRSGLFFEALRIIEDTQPKVAIAENVKNLTSKKFSEQFGIVLDSLEAAGYNNYWQVLNAKDFGVPQNRERVFIVSIRKDIDTGYFKFPEGFPLELRLKDLLESEVDEKYYISDNNLIISTNPQISVKENTKNGYTEATEGDSINFEQPNSKTRRGRVGKQVAQTLTTSPAQGVVTSAAMRGRYNADGQVQQNIEVSDREYANTITTVQKDSMVAQQGIMVVGKINSSQDGKVVDPSGISPTHTAGNNNQPKIIDNLRIRKLIPLECWRLMDFDDEDFYKAEKVCSNSQLYKQAGNSIPVAVLVYIFKNVLEAVACLCNL